MNGFSANKTTVLLDFRHLGLHSALLQASSLSVVFYAATLLAEFGVCNVFGPVAHSDGSWQVLKDLLVRFRFGGSSNDCLSEEKTGSSFKSQDAVRALLIFSVKLEGSNWVPHLSQH